jgi:hypothetical protein
LTAASQPSWNFDGPKASPMSGHAADHLPVEVVEEIDQRQQRQREMRSPSLAAELARRSIASDHTWFQAARGRADGDSDRRRETSPIRRQ